MHRSTTMRLLVILLIGIAGCASPTPPPPEAGASAESEPVRVSESDDYVGPFDKEWEWELTAPSSLDVSVVLRGSPAGGQFVARGLSAVLTDGAGNVRTEITDQSHVQTEPATVIEFSESTVVAGTWHLVLSIEEGVGAYDLSVESG